MCLAGKYDLLFSYQGDGSFDVSFNGVLMTISTQSIPSSSKMTLNSNSTSQSFKATLQFAAAGSHSVLFNVNSASTVQINDLSIQANTQDSYPPDMMFILANGDAGSNISGAVFDAIQSFGGQILSATNPLKPGGSYYLVYDFVSGALVDENMDNPWSR